MLFWLQSVQTCGDVMNVTALISSISGVDFVGKPTITYVNIQYT